MNRQLIQTREQMVAVIHELCAHFSLTVPKLAFNNGRGSRANGKIMHLGLQDWHAFDAVKRDGEPFDFTFSILHEFGHVLDYQRGTNERRDPHGYHYILHLVEIIRFWYGAGNEALYRWHMDYAKVHSYGRQRGWTSRPWFIHADRAKRALARRVVTPIQPSYMMGLSEKNQAVYPQAAQPGQSRPYRAVSRPYTGQRVVLTVNGQEAFGRIEWQRGSKMRVRVRLDAGGLVITPCSNLKTNSVM